MAEAKQDQEFVCEKALELAGAAFMEHERASHKKTMSYVALGAAFGAAIGSAFGVAATNLAVGIPIGVALGVAVGLVISIAK